jgi:hypothetical protein
LPQNSVPYRGMAPYLHTKHFTLDEARRELTVLHALTLKLVELKKLLDERGWDVSKHQYFGGRGPNGDGRFPPEMEAFVEILRSFDQRGVLVKGLDVGILDFPHLRGGEEEVYLCWRLGEDDIGYWHGVREGFAARKNIGEL